jgi:hypothetical protein
MRPQIDTESLRRTERMPLADSSKRLDFVKDPESLKILRQRFADVGMAFDETLTEDKIDVNRAWWVPPMALLEIELGPVGVRSGHDAALMKEKADKYGVGVRAFFAATARVISNATVGGAYFDVGHTRFARSRETGEVFAAD